MTASFEPHRPRAAIDELPAVIRTATFALG
jgi:hypothetical protein